ncbi:MAG: hypothetical protein J4F28_08290 [Nitrosopumilaceae archaeon]|nr:hypothetical protein [Nitrosopumilaceae archaeon]
MSGVVDSEARHMIKLSDIRVHPMDVSLPNEKQARVYGNMASGPGRRALPPVRVGYWVGSAEENACSRGGAGAAGRSRMSRKNGKDGARARGAGAAGSVREITEYVPPYYYLMADVDVYRGCLRAGGVGEIECIVTVCGSEADFLTKHALVTQRYTGYDPLKLGRVVRWLQVVSRGGVAPDGSGRTISRAEAESARRAVEDVMRACRDTIDQKFINLYLADDASDILSQMCEWLSSRLSRFEMPYYIPYRISKAPPGVQAELAEQISLIVRGGSITDARFAWPAPEEIDVLANTPAFRGESETAGALSDRSDGNGGVTVAVPDGKKGYDGDYGEHGDGAPEDSGLDRRGRRRAGVAAEAGAAAVWKPGGKSAPAKMPSAVGGKQGNGSLVLQNTRDAVVIPGTKEHPPYVVDVKTRRVSVVDEHQKVTVLREVGDASSRRGAYLLPVQASEWLRLPGTAAAIATQSSSRGGSGRGGDGQDVPSDGSVRLYTFSSPAGLAKFVKQQEREAGRRNGRGSRGVIIYI